LIKKCITVLTRARQLPFSLTRWIQSSMLYDSIITISHQNPLRNCLLSHTCHAPHPTHTLDLITLLLSVQKFTSWNLPFRLFYSLILLLPF
jgi:hypothetical protein